jgi:hypothetical protein
MQCSICRRFPHPEVSLRKCFRKGCMKLLCGRGTCARFIDIHRAKNFTRSHKSPEVDIDRTCWAHLRDRMTGRVLKTGDQATGRVVHVGARVIILKDRHLGHRFCVPESVRPARRPGRSPTTLSLTSPAALPVLSGGPVWPIQNIPRTDMSQ